MSFLSVYRRLDWYWTKWCSSCSCQRMHYNHGKFIRCKKCGFVKEDSPTQWVRGRQDLTIEDIKAWNNGSREVRV
jgi:hypothetical protein